MKLCRFNGGRLGVVQGALVVDVTRALDVLPQASYPYPVGDQYIAHFEAVLAKVEDIVAAGGDVLRLDDLALEPPVANPSKIIAAPVNYQKHLQEVLDHSELHNDVTINPVEKAGVFLKANSSLAGAGQPITLRLPERRNDHEVELVVVVGKTASRLSASEALDYVAGYCIGVDVTVRGAEERSLRKSSDGYAVIGPWLTTRDEIDDPRSLDLSLKVNGEQRQQANTRDLILGPAELLAYASKFYTLYPGDILFTGTPEGVSRIVDGDQVLAEISGLGKMQIAVCE